MLTLNQIITAHTTWDDIPLNFKWVRNQNSNKLQWAGTLLVEEYATVRQSFVRSGQLEILGSIEKTSPSIQEAMSKLRMYKILKTK